MKNYFGSVGEIQKKYLEVKEKDPLALDGLFAIPNREKSWIVSCLTNPSVDREVLRYALIRGSYYRAWGGLRSRGGVSLAFFNAIYRMIHEQNLKLAKTAAPLKTIVNNLDPDVVSKAKSIKAVAGNFKENVFKKPVEFKVGEYVVTLEAKGSEGDPDIHLSCSCNYWVYQGPEYHAVQNDYQYGKTRGTAQKPDKKDPNGTHKLCKHSYAVLRDFFGA